MSMLKKSQALKGSKEFEKLFRQARPFYFDYLKIRTEQNFQPGVRIGIIVSTKVSKKAVERNRLKRQLRAIFKNLIEQGEFKKESRAVAVTVIKKPNAEQSYSLFKKDIDQWLKKLFLK